jgi:16S rRNA (guanine1207-N2)-methyltransferase
MLAFGNEGLAVPQRALFLGAEPHPELAKWPQITGWQPLKPKAAAWERAGFQRVDEPTGTWPMILVLPGKSRDETMVWFATAYDLLETGGTLVVAMPNTAGAARFEKELAKATGEITSIQKHKCRAFYATKSNAWNDELFAEWRALGGKRLIADTHFTTEAGVFSADHVDPGSQLLADHLPAHFRGSVADLGAGWGFLTDAVLKRCPNVKRMDLFEADARALACAKLNLAGHEREISYHWHDVTTGLAATYDAIVMNPPFHTGQTSDVDLGRSFLKVAAASLNRGGKLLLVANRQLPYEAALEASGLSWRKTAENRIYKLLSAERR